MKGEIDRNYYCSADAFSNDSWCLHVSGHRCREYPKCHNYKYKWPTPEQFKKEYGEDIRQDAPVAIKARYIEQPRQFGGAWIDSQTWNITEFWRVKTQTKFPIIVICTPWGKPPNDWKPEANQ